LSVITVSLILFSILFVYFAVEYSRRRESLPEKVGPLINIEEEELPRRDSKITQGTSFDVNVTVCSETDKELLIPFSLSAIRYAEPPNPKPTSDLEPPKPTSELNEIEATEFTYSYEPSSIILKPGDVKSTILTVELFEDASVGDYTFFIELGDSDVHHVAGTWFNIVVYPK
jgi:hypothetical protein